MYPAGNRETPAPLGSREDALSVTANRHRAVRDALQWLTFSHLPESLQVYSRPFYVAAVEIIRATDDTAELTGALNKLIEAKDWAVRAGIHTDTGRAGSVPRPQEVVDPPLMSSERPEYSRPIRDEPQA